MGEVMFRGGVVMKEYFRNSEATQATFVGGGATPAILARFNPNQPRLLSTGLGSFRLCVGCPPTAFGEEDAKCSQDHRQATGRWNLCDTEFGSCGCISKECVMAKSNA